MVKALGSSAWKRLAEYLRETQLLSSIKSTLYWDQNTSMPLEGAPWRGEQLCLIAKYLHLRQTSEIYEDLIHSARIEFLSDRESGDLEQSQISDRCRNLDLLELDFSRQKKIDNSLVGSLASAKSEGYNLWQEAKSKSNFNCFAPALKKLIYLRKEQSNQLSEPRTSWETLAQPFEPDLCIDRLKELFEPLRKRLPELLDEVRSWGIKNNSNSWDLDEFTQQSLCEKLLNEWGRDKGINSIARSPHPFSTTLGPKDFRITSRVVPGQPFSCFLATAHEWGHSLYEQGLHSSSHEGFVWPIGQATSMSIHESQSLFWENRVARSFAFSKRFLPHFVNAGAPIESSKELWSQLNPLIPGTNRVEADELTYGIHILIRTDLEIALIDNDLSVDELPMEWNSRYEDLLGVRPSNDAEGCLQDVHWSEGLFGYFPSYLLGHLISAQLSESMAKALKINGERGENPIDDCILSKEESKLLDWLRSEVHPHGRKMNAEDLVELVTGSKLNSSPFLNYLENKLKMLKKDT